MKITMLVLVMLLAGCAGSKHRVTSSAVLFAQDETRLGAFRTKDEAYVAARVVECPMPDSKMLCMPVRLARWTAFTSWPNGLPGEDVSLKIRMIIRKDGAVSDICLEPAGTPELQAWCEQQVNRMDLRAAYFEGHSIDAAIVVVLDLKRMTKDEKKEPNQALEHNDHVRHGSCSEQHAPRQP